MPFTSDELYNLVNPYIQLGNSNALAEHRIELNKLDVEKMKTLAIKMVTDCPQEELVAFQLATEALRSPHHPEQTSFHYILNQALTIKKLIIDLNNPANETPWQIIMNEFNPARFHPYNEFTLTLLKDQQLVITRIALTTPAEQRNPVAKKCNTVFPGTAFTTSIHAAFTLQRTIETLLLGNEPAQFFLSRDFNSDTCYKFSALCATLLANKEQLIGEKLALLPEIGRAQVLAKLHLVDKTLDTFKKISHAMIAKLEPIKADQATSSSTAAPQRMFHPMAAKTAAHLSLNKAQGTDHEQEEKSAAGAALNATP